MKEEKQNKSSIELKMNVIISLLLRIANNGDEVSLKDQVNDLYAFGLTSSEIADILGKKSGHISKELSLIKKEK